MNKPRVSLPSLAMVLGPPSRTVVKGVAVPWYSLEGGSSHEGPVDIARQVIQHFFKPRFVS